MKIEAYRRAQKIRLEIVQKETAIKLWRHELAHSKKAQLCYLVEHGEIPKFREVSNESEFTPEEFATLRKMVIERLEGEIATLEQEFAGL